MNHIQNPFEFIYLYNKAAKKDKKKPYVFNDYQLMKLKEACIDLVKNNPELDQSQLRKLLELPLIAIKNNTTP